MQRRAVLERSTTETSISVVLVLDSRGEAQVDTGLPFFDHMLAAFARHGHFDLCLKARGDLSVDAHHTMEDVGLVLGQAIRQAVGNKAGIQRFGWAIVPMDEALARVALDLSGRPCFGYRVQAPASEVGGINVRMFREFFQALATAAGMSLHVDLLVGEDVHHVFEAVFKALARALDQAVQIDPRNPQVPSTKGVLA